MRDPLHVSLQTLLDLLTDFGLLEFAASFGLFSFFGELAGQHTQNQIEDEEGADDDEGDEVDPGPGAADRVVHVVHRVRPTFHGHADEHRQHGQAEVVEIRDAWMGWRGGGERRK